MYRSNSNLTILEFKERLTKLVSPEKEFYLVTPFNTSGTPFCGTYDDKTFELTRNSMCRHVKSISIMGEYRKSEDNSTLVIYKVQVPRITMIILYSILGLLFIALNASLAFDGPTDKSIFVQGNGLLIVVSCFLAGWVYGINRLTKGIVHQRFREEFEIGIEDEWEKLARSNV